MTTKKAVKILEEQLIKLEKSKSESLLFQTRSFIKDFFGDKSEEYEVSKNLTFRIIVNGLNDEQRKNAFKYKQEEVTKFLITCIDTLKTKGVKKEPFFKTISETAFWTIFPLLVTGSLAIGYFFGELKSDKQNIELQLELKNLKDSINFIRMIPSTTVPQKHSNDTTQIAEKP